MDADEIFFIRPWNGEQVRSAIEPWQEIFEEDITEKLLNEKESIMWNSFKDIVFRCHPHIDCYWKDDASDDHQDEIDLETIEIKISVDE